MLYHWYGTSHINSFHIVRNTTHIYCVESSQHSLHLSSRLVGLQRSGACHPHQGTLKTVAPTFWKTTPTSERLQRSLKKTTTGEDAKTCQSPSSYFINFYSLTGHNFYEFCTFIDKRCEPHAVELTTIRWHPPPIPLIILLLWYLDRPRKPDYG